MIEKINRLLKNLSFRYYFFIFLISFLIRFYGLQNMSFSGDTLWIHQDEATYVAAGIWYINFGFWNFNSEHPPFFKLIIGIILRFAGITSTPWIPKPWPAEEIFPYGLSPDYPQPPSNVMFFARLPNVIFGSFTAVLVFYFSQKFL